MVHILSASFYAYSFVLFLLFFSGYQECSWGATQGAQAGVKEIIGGRLEARGDVLERKGVEGRKEIRHLGGME